MYKNRTKEKIPNKFNKIYLISKKKINKNKGKKYSILFCLISNRIFTFNQRICIHRTKATSTRRGRDKTIRRTTGMHVTRQRVVQLAISIGARHIALKIIYKLANGHVRELILLFGLYHARTLWSQVTHGLVNIDVTLYAEYFYFVKNHVDD